MSSSKSSRTLLLEAASAFRPFGVARYTRRCDLPLRISSERRYPFSRDLAAAIEASGTDAISVTPKLLDHAEPEDRTFGGMMQHVQTNQTRVQRAVGRR